MPLIVLVMLSLAGCSDVSGPAVTVTVMRTTVAAVVSAPVTASPTTPTTITPTRPATVTQAPTETEALALEPVAISGEMAIAGSLAHGLLPTQTPTWAAMALTELAVAPKVSDDGYNRKLFAHWKPSTLTDNADKCDARQGILMRDGKNVVVDSRRVCAIVSGEWNDPYTGTIITDPAKVDIDHIVPLAGAWRTGASNWTKDERQAFANDPRNLLATSASANRSKGDRGPVDWKPDNPKAQCGLAVRWVAVKSSWELALESESERTVLAEMLATCKNVTKVKNTTGNVGKATITDDPTVEPQLSKTAEPDDVETKVVPPASTYYKNCSAASAAGAAPLHVGDPGYRSALDRDGDGIACD